MAQRRRKAISLSDALDSARERLRTGNLPPLHKYDNQQKVERRVGEAVERQLYYNDLPFQKKINAHNQKRKTRKQIEAEQRGKGKRGKELEKATSRLWASNKKRHEKFMGEIEQQRAEAKDAKRRELLNQLEMFFFQVIVVYRRSKDYKTAHLSFYSTDDLFNESMREALNEYTQEDSGGQIVSVTIIRKDLIGKLTPQQKEQLSNELADKQAEREAFSHEEIDELDELFGDGE